ncbi:MAG TPA: CTP synthase [Anaerolineaceae bacterium]|nr:CTP synthase [Anaerolineaceae bacterium]
MGTKFIFFTGGVLSSVGKGVAAASIGRLLKSRGFKVTIQKLDPYLNIDPGTLSPYQHGEVYVLDDGSETDLDLGHYERFCDLSLKKTSTVSAGQIYEEVLNRERRGDYLGGTIQVIPHITGEIKRRVYLLGESSGADIALIEVGGTVGDIESQPFLEAIREMRNELPKKDSAFVHCTWLPYLMATAELKTKPTQHSVRELRSIGIMPDMILPRSDHPVDYEIRQKIARFCDVPVEAVVPMVTADMLYEIPLDLEDSHVADILLARLGLEARHEPKLDGWRWMIDELKKDRPVAKIALVGKYVELQDAYLSVREALKHAGLFCDLDIEIDWISSADLPEDTVDERLAGADAIIVPGGFGTRGIEGKMFAARYAREHQVPFLGICLGMQVMAMEFARNVMGMKDATSAEFDSKAINPLVDYMPEMKSQERLGGTMRLGLFDIDLAEGSLAEQCYLTRHISERHRHRYEINGAYREQLEAHGLHVTGLSPEGDLIEIIELEGHPFMVGTQFHPEFLSRPNRPHPLFVGLLQAINEQRGLPTEKLKFGFEN